MEVPMSKKQTGFTLIELMTVVSIISILAAIAIPQFSAYRGKAYTTEGYVLGGDIRKDIIEFYDHTGRMPKDNAEAGLPEPGHLRGKYVQSISVRDGAFDVSFSDKAYAVSKYKTLTARPAINQSDPTAPVLWVWGMDKDPVGYHVMGENRTVEIKRRQEMP
jgi:type IV pilus assembly protein PilA